MINYDEILSNNDHGAFFNALMILNHEQVMELTYRALVGRKMGALEDENVPTEAKIEAIYVLVKWFEEREEYEKCYNLKKIIESLC